MLCLGAQSPLTLWNPMDRSLTGSPVMRILHARILEWVAMPFSRGSSQPTDRNQVSFIAGRFFIIWATREAQMPTYQALNSELSNMWMCLPATSGMSIIAACPPTPIAEDPSAPSSHFLSLLQSVTRLACSLDARPCMSAIVLFYTTFQGTVL